MFTRLRIIVYSFIFVLAASCVKDAALIEPLDVGDDARKTFPIRVYEVDQSEKAQALFSLGRKLFYDPQLSADGQISCATCHQQQSAFSDPSHPLPHGIYGRTGKRNAPGLFNISWMPSFMWDGGINHIEVMPLAPLTDPNEMGENLQNLIAKVEGDENYLPYFMNAFGADSVTMPRILKAFAQFMGEMVSNNSRFDRYARGEISFSPNEKKGLMLFDQHCASCHSGALFTDFLFHNNGLDSVPADPGRYLITGVEADRGLFRTPSLRNVALTPPYMHNGSLETLEKVINHYRFNIKASSNLDPKLQQPIALSDDESQAIIAFLKTLTDDSFIKDPRFSQP